jgi:hypothetical protein
VRAGGVRGALDLDQRAAAAPAQQPRVLGELRAGRRPAAKDLAVEPDDHRGRLDVSASTPTGPPANATETSSPKSCAWPHHQRSGKPKPQFFSA